MNISNANHVHKRREGENSHRKIININKLKGPLTPKKAVYLFRHQKNGTRRLNEGKFTLTSSPAANAARHALGIITLSFHSMGNQLHPSI